MTQRSVLTTQSKLTVQAPVSGERGSSFGDSIILKNTPTAIISNGDYRAICAVLGAMAVAHILVRYPVFGAGRLNGSLLGCLRKDVALVSHCVLGLGRRMERGNDYRCIWDAGEGTVLACIVWTAHSMCTV